MSCRQTFWLWRWDWHMKPQDPQPLPIKSSNLCCGDWTPPPKKKKNTHTIFTQRNGGLLPSTKLTYPVDNRASEQGKSMVGINSLLVSGRVPSTKLTQQWKILIFLVNTIRMVDFPLLSLLEGNWRKTSHVISNHIWLHLHRFHLCQDFQCNLPSTTWKMG